MKITANNLTFRTINKTIVNGVSFSSQIGQKTAIYGPEVSGKKVLLLMLGGFLKPSSGSVCFNDRNIFKDIDGYRNNIGLGEVDSINPLMEEFTPRENLDLCMNLGRRRSETESMRKILEDSDIKTYADTPIAECSPLARAATSLFCAAAGDPEIIILDEPTKRLNTHQAQKFWEIVDKYFKDKTVIFSTKNFEEAKSNAEKIIAVENGCLVNLE
jgi:ABC-type multidrug transport system ATPase subunit